MEKLILNPLEGGENIGFSFCFIINNSNYITFFIYKNKNTDS